MTELQWFKCTDSVQMADAIAGLGSTRKVRLLATACVRRIWYLLNDPVARDALTTAEAFADGRATAKQLQFAAAMLDADGVRPDDSARQAVRLLVQPTLLLGSVLIHAAVAPTSGSGRAVLRFLHLANDPHAPQTPSPPEAEVRAQCRLAREVFGNPWVRVVVRPEWLSWQDRTVRKLARTIYEGRTWEELPILADALEDAGCDDVPMLEHLRDPAEHVRGCWALDVLLRLPVRDSAGILRA